jgi:uncharacterized protein
VSPLAHVFATFILVYKKTISRLLPRSCRYEPTCSTYALEAVRRFGAIKGTGLALRRISRCHPWAPGGVDPVPSERTS